MKGSGNKGSQTQFTTMVTPKSLESWAQEEERQSEGSGWCRMMENGERSR